MKKKRKLGWVLTALRYGLCVVAIVWLAYNVPWYDHVRLGDADGPRARLMEEHDDSVVILRDGQRETVGYEQVHHAEVAGQRVPDIEYGIPSVVRQIDGRLALLALVMFAPVWLLQSYRLVLMVAIQGVKLAYWPAIKMTYAGNFFNFALPGTTGGDLIKAYYVAQYTHLKTEVVTTVFLDRAVGLFSVVVIASVAILLRWDPDQFGYLVGVLATIFGALLVLTVLVFSKRMRAALALTQIAERLPFGAQLLRVGRATVAMRNHKFRVIAALGLSVALQCIVMASAAVMASALGMGGHWSVYFIYVAIGFLIAAIPISPPQAIGVMEAAYVQFFTSAGLATASQAVALALAVRLTQLVWALPGVLVPLLGAHVPSQAELAALEQQAAANGTLPADPPAESDALPHLDPVTDSK